MEWEEATQAAEALGKDWRLPTIDEFRNILHPNKSKLSLNKNDYRSNTDYNFSTHGSLALTLSLLTTTISQSVTMCLQLETLIVIFH